MQKKTKCSMSGIIILSILIIILNTLMAFLFAVHFHLDKGNVLAILFGEKIILLDFAIIFAIGKRCDWPFFKYWNKLKGEINPPRKQAKDK